ncbi:MAG: oligosaccharide flippase family protein [Chloroflexi bacterium]|nr:oligosaccharide flippase family protein [Chloroflexota bacterium]
MVLGILPLFFFWPVLFGGRTLLPVDNLFGFEPYRTFASEWGVSVPHNELLSDLILENYVWKRFIVESLQQRQLPLWNPYLFAGVPFLAAGQHSAIYPFSLLFYVLPLAQAYGVFTALHFALAAWACYTLTRVLGANRLGSLVAGITYAFSSFYVVSVTFSMVIAAAVWLPLLLAIIEVILRKQEQKGAGVYSPAPYMAAGALVLGLQVMAGHIEMTYYTLLVAGFYTAARLLVLWRRQRSAKGALQLAPRLLLMVALGLGLGGLQLAPLYELVSQSFRQGSVSYSEVVGWAYPIRQVFTFFIPNFYGNPSHHAYFDPWAFSRQPVVQDYLGNPQQTIFWGVKNYVEAGSYVGILPLVLAALSVLAFWARQRRSGWVSIPIFALLALLSLAFTFGTPLYAILFYGLPGYNQLHSPFRWIFPYTLSIAVLAGWGGTQLSQVWKGQSQGWAFSVTRWAERLLLVGGLAGALTLAASLLRPEPFWALAERLLHAPQWAQQAQAAFASARVFVAYQWGNLALFFALLAGAGGVLWAWRRGLAMRLGRRQTPLWQPLAAVLVAADLFAVGMGFNPATDPRLLEFEPPAVQFLNEDDELFRITTLNDPQEQKTFNANAGMLYGLQDVRGYDSIIPQQYAQYMALLAPQTDLLYNRIAPIYTPYVQALESPLLHLLGVRYVLTTQTVTAPGYTLVYDQELHIYRNENAMPRAFTLPCTQVAPLGESLEALKRYDVRQTVVAEAAGLPASLPGVGQSDCRFQPAEALHYGGNDVEIRAAAPQGTWLVLADSYFPGWKAYLRPFGSDGSDEQELTIYRVDGNFRGVLLPAGDHVVRFKYTPLSAKLGLFISFIAWVSLFLMAANWVWGRLYRESDADSTLRRVAKNSLTPMALSLTNKLVDFAFAMLRLRILAPEGEGRYTFAISYIGYFEILTIFGLGTLLTREVARDRGQANRYFSNTVALRILLWLAALPLIALGVLAYLRFGGLTPDTAMAIALFSLAIFISGLSDVVSAQFMAHEKMEYPAAISTVTTVLKVSLGALALMLGWGFVGLAGVSVVGNLFTFGVLFTLLRRHCFEPRMGAELDRRFQRQMLGTSFPLMINHLLATVFFRINILLLKPLQGDMAVGYYGAALKYIDGLNIIPSLFTMAIFPLMSRYAASARDTLYRAYVLSLRLLLLLAFPVAVGTAFVAEELILLLGGQEFLPHAQVALQIVIFFFPISCINQVTQYVLIALDQQRFLTKAFAIGVSFNFVGNLLLIPTLGYRGAAIITVLSEIALLLPFCYAVRRHLRPLPWASLLIRPALGSGAMAALLWALRDASALLAVPAAVATYLAALALSGAFRDPDMATLGELLPRSWRPTLRKLLGGAPPNPD